MQSAAMRVFASDDAIRYCLLVSINNTYSVTVSYSFQTHQYTSCTIQTFHHRVCK